MILSILFLAAVVIGIFAVVFGGTLFLSLPLFQVLFPEMALGAIIGNIKFGSVLRNASALVTLRKELDWRIWQLAIPLCVGSLLGAFAVASVTLVIVPFVLLLGLLISENATRIRVSDGLYWIIALFAGIYGGVFGAGIMLVVLALLQLRYPTIAEARANALFLEMLLSILAVIVFIGLNLLTWKIAVIWAVGGMTGGYLGGRIVKSTGKLSAIHQQWLVRCAFVIALTIALWRLT